MKKLCIDPGHGLGNVRGNVYDPGAISAGVSEADIVLQYALAIRWRAKENVTDYEAGGRLDSTISFKKYSTEESLK